ncbi:MAG: transcription antitermination factor NusB [Gammaproteobacteria bacterium]|nr:transcription antitermination factor NusB [Gammaproteobacteria bacterium]
MSATTDSGAPRQPKPAERRHARTLALQALYQWLMARADVHEIEAQFMVDNDMSKVDVAYFRDLLRGVLRHREELDRQLEPFLDRPVTEVDPIEVSILRLGAFELQHRIDVPYRVIINEAIELGKQFGGTEGHKYVNGILDKLARRVRLAEMRPRGH